MTAPNIFPQVIADAQTAPERYIEHQRRQGAEVEIQKPLYHEGVYNVRCVLVIDGQPTRMYFRQSLGHWWKA